MSQFIRNTVYTPLAGSSSGSLTSAAVDLIPYKNLQAFVRTSGSISGTLTTEGTYRVSKFSHEDYQVSRFAQSDWTTITTRPIIAASGVSSSVDAVQTNVMYSWVRQRFVPAAGSVTGTIDTFIVVKS